MRSLAIVAVASVALGGPAFAEAMNHLRNEYKPLINTRAGRLEMRGVHFSSVVTTLDQRPMNIQGSVNTAYLKDKVPALIIKVSVTEARNNTLIRRKVHFASLRIGQQDTSKMKPMPGEDGHSIMLATDMIQTGDLFLTFSQEFSKGAWVSISLDPNRSDYTFRLPPFKDGDADTLQQVSECEEIALNTLMKEMEAEQPPSR